MVTSCPGRCTAEAARHRQRPAKRNRQVTCISLLLRLAWNRTRRAAEFKWQSPGCNQRELPLRARAAANSAVWHRLISDQSINLRCNSKEAGDEGDFSFAAVITATAIGLSLVVAAQNTGPTFSVQTFADRTGVSSTDRDCIFYGNGSIWDSYTNGASSTGQGGQAGSCATAGMALSSMNGPLRATWMDCAPIPVARSGPCRTTMVRPSPRSIPLLMQRRSIPMATSTPMWQIVVLTTFQFPNHLPERNQP